MEKVRAALKIREERYQILFDNIPGAIAFYKGPELEILIAGKSMISTCGMVGDIIGEPLEATVPEPAGQSHIHLLQDVFVTGIARSIKAVQVDLLTEGKINTFYYDFTYSPVRDDDGNIEGVMHSATDVTELVLTRQQMTETDERLNFSLQSARIGTWNYDAATSHIVLDKIARDLYGIKSEQLLPLYQTLENLHPDDVREAYTKMINCLSHENEDECDVKFRVLTENNEIRWLHCTGKAIFSQDKQLLRFGGIVRDISKEVAGIEAQRKLQYQKDNFLSIASHELKTPVTSIKAYAQLLQRMLNKEGDLQKAEMVGRLTGQVNRLTVLLDDLLDVSKISNNRLNFKRDYHVLNEIVENNIRDINYLENKHRIDTHLSFNGNIFCDEGRIGQVISNLISNAIKYSPDVENIIVSTRQQGNEVVLAVQDFGIGINAENRERVFEQFYRVSNAEAYCYQGMGLGLFISAEIIRQEGGRIWVESEEMMGSTFCFALPLISQTK